MWVVAVALRTPPYLHNTAEQAVLNTKDEARDLNDQIMARRRKKEKAVEPARHWPLVRLPPPPRQLGQLYEVEEVGARRRPETRGSSCCNQGSKPHWGVLSQWCMWTKRQQQDDLNQVEELTTIILGKARIRQPGCKGESVGENVSLNAAVGT